MPPPSVPQAPALALAFWGVISLLLLREPPAQLARRWGRRGNVLFCQKHPEQSLLIALRSRG